jgi:hypothetical protein
MGVDRVNELEMCRLAPPAANFVSSLPSMPVEHPVEKR